jgi:hypothetical protein
MTEPIPLEWGMTLPLRVADWQRKESARRYQLIDSRGFARPLLQDVEQGDLHRSSSSGESFMAKMPRCGG